MPDVTVTLGARAAKAMRIVYGGAAGAKAELQLRADRAAEDAIGTLRLRRQEQLAAADPALSDNDALIDGLGEA